MRILPVIGITVAMALAASAQNTSAADGSKPAKTSAKKRARKPVIKPVAAKKPAVTKTVKKPATRRPATPRSSVSAATRAEAHEGVVEKVFRGAELPVENAAALVPFFEQL